LAFQMKPCWSISPINFRSLPMLMVEFTVFLLMRLIGTQ
jgi:hypothetical protein